MKEESMKNAYVMKIFYGDCEPDLRIISSNDGEIISDRTQACIRARKIMDHLYKVTEVLVFEISENDIADYEDLEYSENQVVKLFMNVGRIVNGKIYTFGRKTSDNCSFAVCGIVNASAEVIGIGNTAEEAFADAWNNLDYEEEYTGSPEQLDRLNSDYATNIVYISKEAVKRVNDGDCILFQSGSLVYHIADKDSYEVCTRKEYIHALMTDYDRNFHEWLD